MRYYNPAEWAFFFDLDGTLIDIAATPDAVAIPHELPDLLAHLSLHTDGACAIVTGRSIEAADRMVSPVKLAVAGVHGGEMRMPDGMQASCTKARLTGAVRDAVHELRRRHPQLIVENKGLALAVHFRLAPHLADEVRETLEQVAMLEGGAFCIQPGKMVFEILPANIDKGRALLAFMEEWPFRGRRPIAIGDDLTDERMFVMAKKLGGLGVRVGFDMAPSCATECLEDPRAVRKWISGLLQQDKTSGGKTSLATTPA